MRGAIIERLMCDMEVDLEDIRKQYAPDRDGFWDEMDQLRGLEEEGLVKLEGSRVRVPDEARLGYGLSARCSTPTSLKTRSFATRPQSDLCGDRCDCHPGQAKREPGIAGRHFNLLRSRIRLPQFRGHGRPWRRPSRKTQGISCDWMAGSSPATTLARKFADVFMASSA